MDDTRTTVYFAGFEIGSSEDSFKDLFSQFGNIEKLFLHKTKTYGMVEFDNNRSCMKAIKTLHQQPPLNLYVNMAKNQITNNNNNSSSSSTGNSTTKRPQSFNNKQQNEYFMDETVTYDIEDYFIDENNEFVTVFTDPITNEIYVPLRYAPSLKKVSRKVPRKISNFDDVSVKSDTSERRVKVNKKNDSIFNITIERNVDKPDIGFENASFDNKNGFEKNQGKKKYDQSETASNRWNGENRNANLPVPKRLPAPLSAGSKFVKNSAPKQKYFENRKNDKKETLDIDGENWENKTNEKIVLKTVELPKNQFTEVHVEHVINETVGWVTLTSKTSEFENLTLDICGEIHTLNTLTRLPDVGDLVLALYEELWFRAVILSTTPEIRVRYIDYGNEKVLKKEEIKEIPSAFSKIPAFAVCVKLADGAPCKMITDVTIKVKPVEEENDFIVVHVENGIYEIEDERKSQTSQKSQTSLKSQISQKSPESTEKSTKEEQGDVINISHKLLISQIDIQNIGFLELNISLSKTKFIATFMPLNLTEEAAKLQSINPIVNPSFNPVVGETVCAKNEDGWQRVHLLKIENNIYKVAFIDFGVIDDVTEVRQLPKEFINIPIFSCVCSSINNDDLTQIKETVDFEITDVSGNNISCTITSNEKKIDVVCVPWDPREYNPAASANSPLDLKLKDGEDVKLEMESEGFLYVRNKQAADIRKKIDKFMSENGPKAPLITEKPNVGQLVTAEFEGDFYRAVIKSVKNNNVTICYIDYGNEETLPFFSLRTLNDEMMKMPTSIIKIRLRNFINRTFSVKALEYLEKLSIKNIVLKIVKGETPESGYDLRTSGGLSISDELEKLEAKTKSNVKLPIKEEEKQFYETIKAPSENDPKILMSDLPLEEIPLGKTEVVFQQISDIDNNILCVCVNNPEILHKVQVEMQNDISRYVHKMVPNSPHEPEMEECVLAQAEGKWYRGACTSVPENNEYTIFLLDYGSCCQVSATNIRRMPKEFAKLNALCNFAKFNGLPENINPNRLKALFERNNSYPVNVLEKIEEDECYIIEFPTIIEVLKKENLV